MKRTVKIDPYFSDQPEKSFLSDLTSAYHAEKPTYFGKRCAEAGEADVSGLYIAEKFPDDGGLLETSYADFERFAALYGIAGDRCPIVLRRGETPVFEAWRLNVSEDGIEITAADTEGIRRALVFVEDEMRRREGAFLPLGEIERKPFLRTRITRCFFSPINRPPKFGDELSDDIDYYPEEYLNRLMHEGANAVWIYTRFSDLVEMEEQPSYGKGAQARIEKLNRVCEKCARYGIRPYVFAIEPVALTPEQSALMPDVDGGTSWNGNHLFCTNTKRGHDFAAACGRKLFERCPGLGGFISITYGERPTSCSTAFATMPEIHYVRQMTCPRCKNLTPGEALAKACKALADGIHEVRPDVDVISWTYGHSMWPIEDIKDYVRRVQDDVTLMQNFEETGYIEQLGKIRQGCDYWLSFPGPSERFRKTAEEARKTGKTMFMKTQVCCSHEVATVPYVPVPGILFDRYKAARELGVSGVMQCWYFGNYPSLMSKAAGLLAFREDFSDKKAFLEELAGITWGRAQAGKAAEAWAKFEAGYRNYPINTMFSYYGPMHDGPVWQLALKPKNFSLPRTWQTLDPADGDRIGECLMSGHTLEEAVTLTGFMTTLWHEGLDILRGLKADRWETQEQVSVAETLGVLFESGHAILTFYLLRDRLGRGEGDARSILNEMREIVKAEITRSEQLTALCEADGRLGYHSEGEGYKFFPKKLRHRVEQLKTLLETEFPEVEARVDAGKAPLAYYVGEDIDNKVYRLTKNGIESAAWEPIGDKAAFRAAYDAETLTFEWRLGGAKRLRIDPEFRLLKPDAGIELTDQGEELIDVQTNFHCSVFGELIKKLEARWQNTVTEEEDGTHISVTLNRGEIGWTENRPFKMRFAADGTPWCVEENPVHHLGKSTMSPGEYGWIIPE